MMVAHETNVATGNADVASMAFIATPAVRGVLKTRAKETGMPIYLMADDGTVNGYPALVTNQIVAGSILLGDWSQDVLGEFGVLEMRVDPYTGSNAGTVRVVAFQSVDNAVRNIVAFSEGTSVS